MRRLWGVVLLALAAGTARAETPALASLERDVTVLAFFATWCPPCKKELPMVAALRRRYADDAAVAVIAVSVDDAPKAAAARRLATAAGLPAGALVGDGEALYRALFGGGGLDVPRLAVIDRRGAGLERDGARAGERSDGFVREVGAAVESVRAGAPRAQTLMWRPLAARR